MTIFGLVLLLREIVAKRRKKKNRDHIIDRVCEIAVDIQLQPRLFVRGCDMVRKGHHGFSCLRYHTHLHHHSMFAFLMKRDRDENRGENLHDVHCFAFFSIRFVDEGLSLSISQVPLVVRFDRTLHPVR